MPIPCARGINLRLNYPLNKKKALPINTIDFFIKKSPLFRTVAGTNRYNS